MPKRSHGMTRQPNGKRNRTYAVWQTMKTRCYVATSEHFDRYGGRGIEVCSRWLESFENFLADMGEQPPGMTLERLANDDDYRPGNCAWRTRKENSRNRGDNHLLEFEGKTLSVAGWAEHLGIPHSTIFGRLRMGWSVERILTQPRRANSR
jgi:hypothetical protein